ncbi:MAG: ROK family protein [Alphaproteobacteria bacterium]|nr:ROK family protein [Alphaproteobacteria bacterium]
MRIGIDLGGTKIEGIAIDADGRVLDRRRIPTPQGRYEGTIEAIARLVGLIETATGRRGTVGIGIPGTLSPASGPIKNANSTCLNGKPLDKDLEAALARPVRLANDANCFALSEAIDGAGMGAGAVFGVILGTGVVGGLVLGGRPHLGHNAIAGEWGHTPLPWQRKDEWLGPACWCRKRGCIEAWLSGPALCEMAMNIIGEDLSPQTIALRAEQGDGLAQSLLAHYEDRLARALSTIINILDPDVIVLGGGLSNLSRLYENVPPLLARYAFTDTLTTRLLPPLHGDASGVRGAAWLWPEQSA